MASKGKKGGKKKGQTLNLTEFLGNDGGGAYRAPGASNTATVAVASNWADEMEDEGYEAPRSSTVVLPTAPRAALGPGIDDERIPHRPPYSAYIANLPYDLDEHEVRETFEKARLKIENVRLIKDEGGRLKGYGYADFEDRDSLVNVLTMELTVKNRKIRIDLASQAGKDRPERNNFDRDDRRGRNDDPDAGRSDAGDWRSGPPPPSRDNDRYNGRDSYDRDRYNGRGSYDRDNRGGGRGFSNYEPARDRDGGRYGGFSRGGDRDGGYNRDRRDDREREAPKERPRLNLAPRSKPVEDESADGASSSIFGGAKPVDTVKKEKEMEERLQKEKEEKERAAEEAKKNKPSAASIFGSAKPVDTTQREKEIEDKLSKMSTSEEGGEKEGSNQNRAYKPPARRDDGPGSDRRRDDRDRRDNNRGYDRRDDRGYDKGGYDRDTRDRRPDNRGYDRRDDRGGYDRRNDRRDDRGYDRRDDRGYDNRRDDRGYDNRRDDRGYDNRRDDRGSSSGYDRRDDRDTRSAEKDDRRNTPEPPMKKYEEPKPQNVIAQNKFAFLQEEETGGDSSED